MSNKKQSNVNSKAGGRFGPSPLLGLKTVVDILSLEVRHWCCAFCGTQLDRDINAAVNLRNLAASSAVTAYGVAKITLHCEVGMEHLVT